MVGSKNRISGRSVASGLALAWAALVGAQQGDLSQLSLNDLMQIEVVSASKRPQGLADVAASVFVITGEDIRRSGVRSIPEALRLAPGVQVAQQDGGTWYVGIRGFASRFSNKLLVLVDGRSVYTPLFSGVYWDAIDVPLADIDRIEVVRGPGGAVWGANAVNGVINIVTRSAAETQGGLVTVGSGTTDRAFAHVRMGAKLGDRAEFRVFAKATDHAALDLPDGSSADDAYHTQQVGFRADASPSERDHLTLTMGAFNRDWSQATLSPELDPPYMSRTVTDQNARHFYTHFGWEHNGGPTTKTSVLGNFEHFDRDMPEVATRRTTWSLDLQQSKVGAAMHHWVWGLGFRRTSDQTDGTFLVSLDPADRSEDLWSGFVSDEITLAPKTWLTLGAKLERNGFTGWEFQPSARVLHQTAGGDAVWAAVSRAVRTPSRIDQDGRVNFRAMPGPGGAPTLVALFGSDRFESEKLTSHEIGWRKQFSNTLTLDVSGYYNVYSDLRSFEPQAGFIETDPPPVHGVAPYTFGNNLKGTTRGLEVVARARPTPRWNVMAGFAWYHEDLKLPSGSMDPFGPGVGDSRGATPSRQFVFSSQIDLGRDWQLDGNLYYVDSIREIAGTVDPYWRMDVRLGWRPRADLEIAFVVRNLFDERHEETNSTFLTPSSSIPRSATLQASWRF